MSWDITRHPPGNVSPMKIHCSNPISLSFQLFYLCSEVYQQTNSKDFQRSLGKDIWSIFLAKTAVRLSWVGLQFHTLHHKQRENQTKYSGQVETGCFVLTKMCFLGWFPLILNQVCPVLLPPGKASLCQPCFSSYRLTGPWGSQHTRLFVHGLRPRGFDSILGISHP